MLTARAPFLRLYSVAEIASQAVKKGVQFCYYRRTYLLADVQASKTGTDPSGRVREGDGSVPVLRYAGEKRLLFRLGSPRKGQSLLADSRGQSLFRLRAQRPAVTAKLHPKKVTCLGLTMSLRTRSTQHPPPRSFLAGHPLQRGTKILQSLALHTWNWSPFEGGSEERAGDVLPGLHVSSTVPTASQPPFSIPGPAPRWSWLAMTRYSSFRSAAVGGHVVLATTA